VNGTPRPAAHRHVGDEGNVAVSMTRDSCAKLLNRDCHLGRVLERRSLCDGYPWNLLECGCSTLLAYFVRLRVAAVVKRPQCRMDKRNSAPRCLALPQVWSRS
jgi:hypothetical protein